MRLDRFLANMGCGSRREVKELIRSGKIAVNNNVVTDGACQVNPVHDVVIAEGKIVQYQKYIYLMLNKPAGIISATDDKNQSTVLDLLDRKYLNKGIFPVGRLDKDTEGLLVLTNHGELGHQLLSPRKHVPKRYFARVDGELTEADQQSFAAGIQLEDFRALPAQLEILNSAKAGSEALVVIYEGKFHQIKRMFQSRGRQVTYLKRMAMGELELDPALGPGQYRELTSEEIGVLINSSGENPEKREKA